MGELQAEHGNGEVGRERRASPTCRRTPPRNSSGRRPVIDWMARCAQAARRRPGRPRDARPATLRRRRDGEDRSKVLSGGEQRRMIFGKLMLEPPEHACMHGRADQPPRHGVDRVAEPRAREVPRHADLRLATTASSCPRSRRASSSSSRRASSTSAATTTTTCAPAASRST